MGTAKVCSHPGCPNLRPCTEHQPKPWANARQRRPNVPTGRALQQRNDRILTRDHGTCHVCKKPGATKVDHITPVAEGGTEDDTNLAPIHEQPCHQVKSSAEAARGRARAKRSTR